MLTTVQTITNEALKLGPEERVAIVQRLLASLEPDARADDALAEEVARRMAEIEHGSVKTIPMHEALAQVRASLK